MQRSPFALLVTIGLLVLSPFTSYTMAESNGGLLFDQNSITLDGDGDVGDGPLWVNLTVKEMLGDFANGTITVDLSTIEGTPDTAIQIVNASPNSIIPISLFFPNVQVGLYTLEVNLSGDVDASNIGPDSANGSNWNYEWTGIVSKLRPLSVGLAAIGQWDIIATDDVGNVTTTLRDGNNLSVEVPVINLGDVNASGNFSWIFDGGNANNLVVNTIADQTQKIMIEIGPVDEGQHSLLVNIDFSGDTVNNDNSATLPIIVNPPPLPRLSLLLSSDNSTTASLGDAVEFVIEANNDGESDWTGYVVCTNPDVNTVVYNSSVSIATGQTWNHTLNITATPGRMECVLEGGGRIAADSSPSANQTFEMPAAAFVPVGGGDLSVSGGPWHVGDIVSTNLVVHNGGDLDGTATLYLRQGDGDAVTGPTIAVTSGSSNLLETEIEVTNSGNTEIAWWISSLDGTVDVELSGVFTVLVQSSQTLNITINSIEWDASNGVTATWSVELSSGIERMVSAEVGIRIDGIDYSHQIYDISLSPGLRQFESKLGEFNGQGEVYVRLTPESWVHSGLNEISAQIPTERPTLRLEQGSETAPPNPVETESVVVNCLLHNDGSATSRAGVVRLLGPEGLVLDEKTSDKLQPSSLGINVEMDVNSWPEGNVVDLRCWWRVGDDILIAESSHISGTLEIEDESLLSSIPVTEVIYGVIIAVVITLISRLAYGWKNADPDRKISKDDKEVKESVSKQVEIEEQETPKSTDKQEVPCPSCLQRLSIPLSFSGTVRCPSCRNEFNVEGDDKTEMPPPVKSEEEITIEEEPEILKSASNSDILPCPKCESKLRVKMEKRPVRARCPACKVEFMAHSE